MPASTRSRDLGDAWVSDSSTVGDAGIPHGHPRSLSPGLRQPQAGNPEETLKRLTEAGRRSDGDSYVQAVAEIVSAGPFLYAVNVPCVLLMQ
jgi:hypothetical protein